MPKRRQVTLFALDGMVCFGQTVTGSLTGHVSDATGGAVAGAKVTNDRGNYTISSMETGVYKVQVEQAGFKSFIKDRVEVASNSIVRVQVVANITGTGLAAHTGQGFKNQPSSTGPVRYLGGTGRGRLWFDTKTFVEPVPGTIGTVGRNAVRGPGYANYNVTLSRMFRCNERLGLNMMMSAFNVTNSTHFNDPSGSFTGSQGQITSSFGERQVRLGARLEF